MITATYFLEHKNEVSKEEKEELRKHLVDVLVRQFPMAIETINHHRFAKNGRKLKPKIIPKYPIIIELYKYYNKVLGELE
jgi:hypothetical protein